MKKIILLIVNILCFQQALSMLKTDEFESVSLDELSERQKIVSYEALSILAIGMKDKKNTLYDIVKYYDVKPIALSEYIVAHNKQMASFSDEITRILSDLRCNKFEEYDFLATEVFDKICQSKRGKQEDMISQMEQLFQENAIKKIHTAQQEIEKISPEYYEKKRSVACYATVYSVMGLVATAGLSGIGLVSWVIAHCHHPWN